MNRVRWAGGILIATALAGVSVASGAASAQAYSVFACHWNSSSPSYQNQGGSGFSAEVTNAVGEWVTRTDIASMSAFSGSHFVIGYSNMGANGMDGVTARTCAAGTMLDALSRVNTYYTNFYTAAMRKATWVHEIGHGLGLNHSSLPNAVMNACGTCAYSNYGINFPATDDVNGMNSIY